MPIEATERGGAGGGEDRHGAAPAVAVLDGPEGHRGQEHPDQRELDHDRAALAVFTPPSEPRRHESFLGSMRITTKSVMVLWPLNRPVIRSWVYLM